MEVRMKPVLAKNEMKIIKKQPPNIQEINEAGLFYDKNSLFCWGEEIYTLATDQIYPDILYHEQIHSRQQKVFGSPEMWWKKYLINPEFRKDQEVEAFAEQLKFVRIHYKNKEIKDALNEFAGNLSSNMYNLGLSIHQAETLIRKYDQKGT